MWVTMPNLIAVGQTHERTQGVRRKNWALCVSLKVIGTDSDRSGTYDFLL